MVSKIIDGIAEALYEEFGDGCEIYTETVKQGLNEPCFIVRCLAPSSRIYRGKRYQCQNQFALNYFPATADKNAELGSVTVRLYDRLELIVADGELLRGTGMSSQIVDDVLHFFVDYDFFSYRREDTEAMDEYSYTTNMEG